MTTFSEVDRIVEEHLRDQPDHQPVPALRLPAGPCPSWCRMKHGHPYLTERPSGLQSRYHESEIIASRDLGSDGQLAARMIADEYRTPTGQTSLTAPRIALEGPVAEGVEQLDVRQARALADLLLEAAERLETVEQPETAERGNGVLHAA